jgi:hypothetical protein
MPEYLDIVSTLLGLPVIVADFQKDVADWQNICRNWVSIDPHLLFLSTLG